MVQSKAPQIVLSTEFDKNNSPSLNKLFTLIESEFAKNNRKRKGKRN